MNFCTLSFPHTNIGFISGNAIDAFCCFLPETFRIMQILTNYLQKENDKPVKKNKLNMPLDTADYHWILTVIYWLENGLKYFIP